MPDERCIYCEVADGIRKSEGQKFVTIHRSCLVTLQKQISDALEGLNAVSNLASQKYSKVYHQYQKEKPKESPK